MLVLNKVSRYDVASVAIEAGRTNGDKLNSTADQLIQQIKEQVNAFWKYVDENAKGLCYRVLRQLNC